MHALAGPRVAVTGRPDGHYILAISGRGRLDPTPQLLRFAPHFVPMFAKRWRNVFPGGLEGIRWGHETRARWKLDAPAPMERARVLDPKPDPAGVRETHRRALDLLPALREARIANTWAGHIDSTPDGVPGIGEVPQVPGFIVAAGFSGHGFGIGPGAGHLIADLVSGAQPIFDPAPFNPARFDKPAWGRVADFWPVRTSGREELADLDMNLGQGEARDALLLPCDGSRPVCPLGRVAQDVDGPRVDINHPDLRNAGARVEARLGAEVEGERRVGDFDDEKHFRGGGMRARVIVGPAPEEREIRLGHRAIRDHGWILDGHDDAVAAALNEELVQLLDASRMRTSDRRHLDDLPVDQLQPRIGWEYSRLAHAEVLLGADRVLLRVFENRAHREHHTAAG
jgi:hypothetical protein